MEVGLKTHPGAESPSQFGISEQTRFKLRELFTGYGSGTDAVNQSVEIGLWVGHVGKMVRVVIQNPWSAKRWAMQSRRAARVLSSAL